MSYVKREYLYSPAESRQVPIDDMAAGDIVWYLSEPHMVMRFFYRNGEFALLNLNNQTILRQDEISEPALAKFVEGTITITQRTSGS